MEGLAEFVKARRKEVGLTQEEFADRAGVALTVVRKIEQGKTNLNMDKVNFVLSMFGHHLAVVDNRSFHPKTYAAIIGNLHDRKIITNKERDKLLSEKEFNSTNFLDKDRTQLIRKEIDILYKKSQIDEFENSYFSKK